MGMTERLEGPDLAAGVRADALTEGRPLLGHFAGTSVVLVRCRGVVRAVGGHCTHHGAPLSEGLVVGETIRCPWHHAAFDLRTGAVDRPPALAPLPTFVVVEEADRVRVVAHGVSSAPAQARSGIPGGRFVIVGAGAAGAAAAAALRAHGFAGSITMVDEQPSEPVDRPNLSKEYLAGRASSDWLPLFPAPEWAALRVDRRTDVVRRIDPAGRTIGLGSGITLAWDRLLLAPGARAIRLAIPSGSLSHVKTLRSLGDAEQIVAVADRAQHVAVVGSSFIGMEVAAALCARGLVVTVISPDRVPFERLLGMEAGAWIQARFEARGVRFRWGRRPQEITPTSVLLDDGTSLPADLVVVGIGVRPRIELAQRSGIPFGDGILVDRFLETGCAGIFAAGDVAEWPEGPGRQRVEHWVMAQRQGRTAAANMLGHREPYQAVPFFWSNFLDMGCDLTFVGRLPRHEPTRQLLRSEAGLTLLYRDAGELVAVATVGEDGASLLAEQALEGGGDAELRLALGIATVSR